MKKKDGVKISKRKIPKYFRAVERDTRPITHYGVLVSDDGINVVCVSARGDDTTHLKERVLEKHEWSFTKITLVEFMTRARPALLRMRSETQDKKFAFEAMQSEFDWAEAKFREIASDKFNPEAQT